MNRALTDVETKKTGKAFGDFVSHSSTKVHNVRRAPSPIAAVRRTPLEALLFSPRASVCVRGCVRVRACACACACACMCACVGARARGLAGWLAGGRADGPALFWGACSIPEHMIA